MCWRPRLRSSAHARWLIRGNQRTPEECEFPAGGLVPQVRVPPLDANLGSERPAPVHPSSSAHDHSPSTPIRSNTTVVDRRETELLPAFDSGMSWRGIDDVFASGTNAAGAQCRATRAIAMR